MPLHCSPLFRRQFIRRSVLGGLAILTWRQGASAAGVDANRWALLSDPHIAADPAATRPVANAAAVNMTEHLRVTVAELTARDTRPVGLIVNGDCPFDVGLPADYTQFLELLKPIAELKVPMHFTLGNHDHRENFWAALTDQAALPRPVEGKQISVIETPLANWFLLDSLEKTKATPGVLGEAQRTWLAKALDERANKPALLMVHHNPVSSDPAKSSGLTDSEELFQVIMPRKQVKAVFFGHTHRWDPTQREGLHLVNLPAVAYPFGANQPTGWVDCQLAENGMKLELRAHDTAHAAHGVVREFAWRA
ncbi:MAG TPA: metallophosphoesterase [Chthoniobacteraceae bacterium]|jgi:3',5'-cyclic AMP phosphodiesterase CpdA|nr:metallophosphoesterase [Chthoniobacteraceae bacterium]